MKVLLVNSLYPPRAVGGAELSVRHLAEELTLEGHETSVLTLRTAQDKAAGRLLGDVRVFEHELRGPWPFDSSWHNAPASRRMRFHLAEARRPDVVRTMRRVLEETQPDIVNTHNIAGFGTSVWTPVTQPLVHSMHDYYLLCPRTGMYRNSQQCASMCRDCKIATLPRRHARRRPDGFTAVSAHVLNVHRGSGYLRESDRVEVVPNAVAVRDVQERTLEHLGTLGFIGRLEASKGLGVLLTAVASEPQLAGLDVVVAGRGMDEEVVALEAWRERGVKITYLGYVPPSEFFSRVDCVCVPTQWAEPYGRVAAEARSLNLPVVASRTGGLIDVLSGYDGAHLIHDLSAPEAWAQTLIGIRKGWAARRVGGRGSADTTQSTERYMRLFEATLQQRQATRH